MLRRANQVALMAMAFAVLCCTTPVHGHAGSRRLVDENCEDNPVDYTVSLDLQVDFENGVVTACSGDSINNKVQEVLNGMFGSTVGGSWAGRANFQDFVFDPDQAVNGLVGEGLQTGTCASPRTDLLGDNCPADVCLFGCLIAQTTNCGIPSLTNWDLLERDIQTGLADLGDACLGTLKNVVMVVGDPDARQGPTAPLDSTTGGDDKEPAPEPAEEPAPEPAPEPAEEPAPEPAEEPAPAPEPAPGPGANVSRPADRPVPAAGPSGNQVTASVSRPADRPATVTASVSRPVGQKTSATGTDNRNGQGNEKNQPCNDNAMVYNVAVDIQVDFQGSSSTDCSNNEWVQIRNKIKKTLNDEFTNNVQWNGDVGFGTAAFDTAQEVNNIERRRLQMLRGRPDALDQERRLQNSGNICPMERDIACDFDVCHWACLIAPTTSCGINSLASWAVLAQEVETKLKALGYACLGSANDLVVNILVDEPTVDSATRSGGSGGTGSGFQVVEASDRSTGDTASDVISKALEVQATLTVDFFGGAGALPDTASIFGVEAAVAAFFKTQLSRNPQFQSDFLDFTVTNMLPDYDFSNPDEFFLTFLATVFVNEDSTLSSHAAANAMAAVNYREFITDYFRGHGGEFEETFKVHFRGVTPAKL